jgi:hypothetical protein
MPVAVFKPERFILVSIEPTHGRSDATGQSYCD